jgi:hypothetical protein
MGIALEKRLRKLEKAEEAEMDELRVDHEELRRREEMMKFACTPEPGAAMSSAERIVNAMRARDHARIEAITPPEPLARLRKQWAEEDARDEALKAENERVEAWIESISGREAWIEKYCPPRSQKNTDSDKAKTLDEDEGV